MPICSPPTVILPASGEQTFIITLKCILYVYRWSMTPNKISYESCTYYSVPKINTFVEIFYELCLVILENLDEVTLKKVKPLLNDWEKKFPQLESKSSFSFFLCQRSSRVAERLAVTRV